MFSSTYCQKYKTNIAAHVIFNVYGSLPGSNFQQGEKLWGEF